MSIFYIVMYGTEDVESRKLSKWHSLISPKLKNTFFPHQLLLSTWRNVLNPVLYFSKNLCILDCYALERTSTLIF